MLDWILLNKQWVFSGIGIFIISSIISLIGVLIIIIFKRKHSKSIKQKSGGNSFILEGGGNINFNVLYKEEPKQKPLIHSLKDKIKDIFVRRKDKSQKERRIKEESHKFSFEAKAFLNRFIDSESISLQLNRCRAKISLAYLAG